jgi:hypothetical protein
MDVCRCGGARYLLSCQSIRHWLSPYCFVVGLKRLPYHLAAGESEQPKTRGSSFWIRGEANACFLTDILYPCAASTTSFMLRSWGAFYCLLRPGKWLCLRSFAMKKHCQGPPRLRLLRNKQSLQIKRLSEVRARAARAETVSVTLKKCVYGADI